MFSLVSCFDFTHLLQGLSFVTQHEPPHFRHKMAWEFVLLYSEL